VLAWIDGVGEAKTVEYRVFASPAGLLAAIGRGIEPLSDSVRKAARPLTPTGRLCSASRVRAARLLAEAAWRPWVLDRG
jgi:hypothetical protein